MLWLDAFDRNSVSTNCPCHEKCSGLDPVRDDVVLSAVQFLDAFNDDPAGAGAFNLRAHLVQEIRKIDNFRFLSGAFNHGRSLSQHGRHHHVVGPENSGPKFPAQIDHRAGEFRRKHFYIACFHANGRTERFESLQMQINRPIANDATTRQRNRRLFAPAKERTNHANRRAHFADDIVGSDRIYFYGRDCDGAAGAFYLRAEVLQNLQHVVRVAQIGHAPNRARLASEKRRRQNRQSRIFRAADFDRSAQRTPPVDPDFIHTWLRQSV